MGWSWDDRELLFEQPGIRDFDLLRIFGEGFWAGRSGVPIHRPVTALSLALDRMLFGPDPIALHRVNLLLHSLASLVTAAALGRIRPGLFPLAFLVLFLHPLGASQAGWISGRSESLAMLCGGGALFVSLGNGGRLSEGARALVTAALLLASALSREDGILLVFPILVYAGKRRRRLLPALASAATVWVVLRLIALGTLAGGVDPPSAASGFLTAADTFARGLGMLLLVEPIRAMSDGVPSSGAFILLLPAVLVLLCVALSKRNSLAAPLAWMLLAFLPFSHILPLRDGITARFVFPMLPPFLLIVTDLAARMPGGAARLRAWAPVALLLLPLWFRELRVFGNQELLFARALELQPGSRRARLLHALGMEGNGRKRAALDALRVLHAEEPSYGKAASNLGRLLLETGRIEEAVGVLDRAVYDYPRNRVIPLLLGRALRGSGRIEEALVAFEEATARDPRMGQAYREQVRCLLALGRKRRAVEVLALARKVDPRHPALARLERLLEKS